MFHLVSHGYGTLFYLIEGFYGGNEEKWDQGMVYLSDVESPIFFIYFLLFGPEGPTLNELADLARVG